jgi:hypothetical protein
VQQICCFYFAHFSLTFDLMVITDEPLVLGMLPKLKWLLFLLKPFTVFIFLTHITIF